MSRSPDPHWWHYQTLTSTNDQAKLLAAGDWLKNGSVIIADEQTHGRGQQNTAWLSKAGESLTCSFVYFPNFLKASDQFYLNMIVTLGIVEALKAHFKSYGDSFAIKWPNDILLKEKKLGGILIENLLEGAYLQQAVVGIGINLNQTLMGKELPGAISLRQLTGRHHNPLSLVEILKDAIDNQYTMLRDGNKSKIYNGYLNNLYLFHRWHQFKAANGKTFQGCISGINNYGNLLIVDKANQTRAFGLKEIQF